MSQQIEIINILAERFIIEMLNIMIMRDAV